MIRLLDGVFTWPAFSSEKRFNFNGHLLTGPEGTLLVDPVDLAAADLAYMEAAGLKPDVLVITNRNHLRARDAVVARWSLPTLLHEAEAEGAGVRPDETLRHGQEVRGWTVVHLPGKSPGEIALHSRARRALLVGDALIAPYGRVRTVPADKQDDPALLRRSLERLRGLEFDALLVGDGDPVLSGAKAAVLAFLDAK